jgi:hypothetical protein
MTVTTFSAEIARALDDDHFNDYGNAFIQRSVTMLSDVVR